MEQTDHYGVSKKLVLAAGIITAAVIVFCTVLTLTIGFNVRNDQFDFYIAASLLACTLFFPAIFLAVFGIVNASKAMIRGNRAGKKLLIWGIIIITAAQMGLLGFYLIRLLYYGMSV